MTKIVQCGKDQKALFRVIEALLHKRSKPKLPEHENIQDILKSFNEYFTPKIALIRENLDAEGDSSSSPDSTLHSEINTTAAMVEFTNVSSEGIKKIILGSSTKTCDLDPIPTWMMKLDFYFLVP